MAWIELKRSEARAVLTALRDHVPGALSGDFGKWLEATGGTRTGWNALVRTMLKLESLANGR